MIPGYRCWNALDGSLPEGGGVRVKEDRHTIRVGQECGGEINVDVAVEYPPVDRIGIADGVDQLLK